jgi:tRNA dimethylallyltransferase
LSDIISPLLVIAGPTASGKSALAVHLARKLRGEIVNCDSLQLYRGMDIGTAKPSMVEREIVPHHLYDVRDPDQVFTAGEYSRLARPVLAEIAQRRNLPIVTGGAGFYLRALLEGLFPGPTRSDSLRERLLQIEQKRPGMLHRLLNRWDITSASRIHANDVNKTVRALEVILTERQPLSEAYRKERGKLKGFGSLKIGLNPPRAELRARIARRTVAMFQQGLLDEVQNLSARGYGRDAKAMESVGYRQAHAVLNQELTIEQAIADTTLRTGQYAKRQLTWFRRDPEFVWLEGFGEDSAVQAQAESALQQFLALFTEFCST